MLFYEDKLLSQAKKTVIRQQSCTARDSLPKTKLNVFSKRLIFIWIYFQLVFLKQPLHNRCVLYYNIIHAG